MPTTGSQVISRRGQADLTSTNEPPPQRHVRVLCGPSSERVRPRSGGSTRGGVRAPVAPSEGGRRACSDGHNSPCRPHRWTAPAHPRPRPSRTRGRIAAPASFAGSCRSYASSSLKELPSRQMKPTLRSFCRSVARARSDGSRGKRTATPSIRSVSRFASIR